MLELLRVFVAVAERLHVTQAAAALNMTQSAASAAIRTLERRLAARLFSRVGRHIELTEAGTRAAGGGAGGAGAHGAGRGGAG